MKVLTVEDKVACVGNENEPTLEVETPKLTKEELNRYLHKVMLDVFRL